MKLVIMLMFFSVSAFATIPVGNYQVEKIQCHKSQKVLKLGGKFMVYTIKLNVQETQMVMTATAKSGSWAPFKLNCEQVNKGKIVYTKENTYEGDLPNVTAKCNNSVWTGILKKKLFGVENYGEFTYSFENNKLTIFNPKTITRYSCTDNGDYPVYFYKKI